jgi:hypothetical protein
MVGIPMTSSLAKEGVSVASEQATPTSLCKSFSGEWRRSSVSSTFQAVPRDVAHARECPPVPKCTRLVPAKRANFVGASNNICPVAGLFSKAPWRTRTADPSLPWNLGRNRSQPTATVFASLSPVRRRPICHRLPPVATAGLHKGSILSCSSWLQTPRRGALSARQRTLLK